MESINYSLISAKHLHEFAWPVPKSASLVSFHRKIYKKNKNWGAATCLASNHHSVLGKINRRTVSSCLYYWFCGKDQKKILQIPANSKMFIFTVVGRGKTKRTWITIHIVYISIALNWLISKDWPPNETTFEMKSCQCVNHIRKMFLY